MKNVKELKRTLEENNCTGRFYPLVCDLTKESDILNAFKWIDENIGGIHFMINNAGIVRISPLIGKNVEISIVKQLYLIVRFLLTMQVLIFDVYLKSKLYNKSTISYFYSLCVLN